MLVVVGMRFIMEENKMKKMLLNLVLLMASFSLFAEIKSFSLTGNDGFSYNEAIFSNTDSGKYYDESYVYGLKSGLPRIGTEGWRFRFNSFDEYDNIESIFDVGCDDWFDEKRHNTFMKACCNILKKYGYIRMDIHIRNGDIYTIEYFRVDENRVIERFWVAKKITN